MLSIIGIEKLATTLGPKHKVYITRVHANKDNTYYEILYQHEDYPNNEFYVSVGREGQVESFYNEMVYPMWFNNLSKQNGIRVPFSIFQSNIKTMDQFMYFIGQVTETLIINKLL